MDGQQSGELSTALAWELSEQEATALRGLRASYALAPGCLVVAPIANRAADKRVAPGVDLYTIEGFSAGRVVAGFKDSAAYQLGDLILYSDHAGIRLLHPASHAAELKIISVDDLRAVHRSNSVAAEYAEGETWLV